MDNAAKCCEPSRRLISVIVCTHNRAKLLRRALTSIVRQDFPTLGYEVLVIDNASTDETREVVEEFRHRANLRYIHEEQLGLCVARNTGWRAASGKYIAFLDDDAIALPGWLSAIRDCFESDANVGIVGGPAHPIWERQRPRWISDQLAVSLAIIDWGPSKKVIRDLRREWLVGTNIAVSKALLQEVDGFHPWLDRVGSKLLSNGDILLQKQVIGKGYDCAYLPGMAIQHLVPASRLHRRWFLRRFFWQGVSDAVMYSIEDDASPRKRARLAAKKTAAFLVFPARYLSALLAAKRPHAFTSMCLALIRVGFVVGITNGHGR